MKDFWDTVVEIAVGGSGPLTCLSSLGKAPILGISKRMCNTCKCERKLSRISNQSLWGKGYFIQVSYFEFEVIGFSLCFIEAVSTN